MAARRKGPARADRKTRRGLPLGRVLAIGGTLAAAAILAGWLGWRSIPDPSPLATKAPPVTALMDQRRAEAERDGRPWRPDYRPVSLDRISPRLVRAVIASEDASFFGHSGFDWDEMQKAAEQNWKAGRTVRGASTITQQLAKNLWLGTERSYLRKAREAVMAVRLERTLSKRRILTLYLDVAEWGQGVFGAEAASRRWFGIPARDLSAAQASILAAMLPAPRKAALGPAPRWLARRSRRILGLLERNGTVTAGQAEAARAELERLLAGQGDGGDEPPDE